MKNAIVKYSNIWKTIALIPKGKVASYGQIADLAGLPGRARLVGKSLNSIPNDVDIPWYRVIRSNGQIAFPLGSEQAEKQKGLLQAENVCVLNNRIKMREFQWKPDLADILFKLTY